MIWFIWQDSGLYIYVCVGHQVSKLALYIGQNINMEINMRNRKEKEDIEFIDSLEDLGGPVMLVDTGRGIYITQDGKCLIGAKIGIVDDDDMDEYC